MSQQSDESIELINFCKYISDHPYYDIDPEFFDNHYKRAQSRHRRPKLR